MGIYDDRKVYSAEIGAFHIRQDKDGQFASVSVWITASGLKDDLPGPSIQIDLALPADDGSSIRDMKLEAANRARDFLGWLARQDLSVLTVPAASDFPALNA